MEIPAKIEQLLQGSVVQTRFTGYARGINSRNMQPMKLTGIVVLGLALFASACRKEDSPHPSAVTNAVKSSELKTYLVNGGLRKLAPAERTATIQHEEIPGYMPAMTMPFTVKNTNELA